MDFIAIDLETTGTLPYVDRIVELAALRFSGNQVVDHFQTLIHPGIEISAEISKINGITNEMVKTQPPIQDVLESFSKFCGASIMVAHNASFDFQFLRSAIEKHKSVAPLGPVLDTYSLAKKVMPGMNNYKLSTLVQYLKIDHAHLHRAWQDAKCCGHLFYHIMKKLEIQNWKKLAQISGKTPLHFPQIAPAYKQLELL